MYWIGDDQTTGNILQRHGIAPAPERRKEPTWKEFIRAHREVLAATDFFAEEVRTCFGLITYYVLVLIRLHTREVHLAGIIPHLTEAWMRQVARNVTMAEIGLLNVGGMCCTIETPSSPAGWRMCFLQDGTGAIFVNLEQKGIVAGQNVEVKGITSAGGFTPEVVGAKFRVLNRLGRFPSSD